MMKISLFALLFAILAVQAEVKLPSIFSDHMVLQRAAKVPVWGQADPGEPISISLDRQTVKTTASPDGKWQVALDLSRSKTGPFKMTVQGENIVTISDVLVGEVWLASGQSNMEWILFNSTNGAREIAESSNSFLRQFRVQNTASLDPLENCEGQWTVATPQTAGLFTAVGYFFGKKIQQELKVPIGLINSSWGGTPSEAWTSPEFLVQDPALKRGSEHLWSMVKEHPDRSKEWSKLFAAWLKHNHREDSLPRDAPSFAAPDASTAGWVPITLPGPISGGNLPETGVVWIRKDVKIEPSRVNTALGIALGVIDGFESVYWNGELIHAMTPNNYPGTGFSREGGAYYIPANKVTSENNTIAIRVFEPLRTTSFDTVSVGDTNLTGEWLAKVERNFPNLTPPQIETVPVAPAALPGLQQVAGSLYNAMINPIVPFAIKGAIWYQGEANAGRAFQYRTAFPLMIASWRSAWQQGDFPFYFCQLANFNAKTDVPSESDWAELRESQSFTLEKTNTGQAVLIDVGESADIHPRNKKSVGERLAAIAVAKDYGKAIPFSGPVYQSAKFADGKVVLTFTHTDGGLEAKPVSASYDVMTATNTTAPTVRNSPDSDLEGFALCGADKKWVWADAKIEGETVVVWSDQVPQPVAARYAWAENPTCNLFNGAGFPASPFRTDDFPLSTRDAQY